MTARKPAKRIKDVRDETASWLTRRQAMDLLGVSTTSLYRWEDEGRLHPRQVQRWDSVRLITVYDPDELARMPRRNLKAPVDDGELTARAFEMFDDGKSVREIVLALRQTVAKIEAMHEQWLDAGGAAVVVSKEARQELERFVGSFETIAELVERVQHACGEAIEAVVPDAMSDADVEREIVAALDAASEGNAAERDRRTKAA